MAVHRMADARDGTLWINCFDSDTDICKRHEGRQVVKHKEITPEPGRANILCCFAGCSKVATNWIKGTPWKFYCYKHYPKIKEEV